MSLMAYQAGIVQRLLESTVAVLCFVPESDEKKALCSALAEFDDKIVPSAIYLDEVVDYLKQLGISVETTVAREILIEAAYDIDSNNINSVVEYHAEEYASKLAHAQK